MGPNGSRRTEPQPWDERQRAATSLVQCFLVHVAQDGPEQPQVGRSEEWGLWQETRGSALRWGAQEGHGRRPRSERAWTPPMQAATAATIHAGPSAAQVPASECILQAETQWGNLWGAQPARRVPAFARIFLTVKPPTCTLEFVFGANSLCLQGRGPRAPPGGAYRTPCPQRKVGAAPQYPTEGCCLQVQKLGWAPVSTLKAGSEPCPRASLRPSLGFCLV